MGQSRTMVCASVAAIALACAMTSHAEPAKPKAAADRASSKLLSAVEPPAQVVGAVPAKPALPTPNATPKVEAKKEPIPAKDLFGAATTPSPLAARAVGFYAHGCLAGGVSIERDGPEWQVMRLSRNRSWGHPELIKLVKRLASEARKEDNWPGLLIGDIAQPRGGPMTSGHASHQVGLDADIWLTPMPNRSFTDKEREDLAATSMLDATSIAVDPKIFTPAHIALLKRAASYSTVNRLFVHPAIKKALCTQVKTDRSWLHKVRPIWGHYYHFHIRMMCPPGSVGCVDQAVPGGDEGCGKDLDAWLKKIEKSVKVPAAPPPKPSVIVKPGKGGKPPLLLAQLPMDCRKILEAGGGPKIPKEALLPPPAPPKKKKLIKSAKK